MTEKEQLPAPIAKAVARLNLRVVLPLVAAIVIACSVLVGFGWYSFAELKEQRLNGCRDRNSAQELGRRDDRLEIVGIGLYAGLTPEQASAAVIDITADMSTAEEADSDCDGDGWLTAKDYTVPKPANLPLLKEDS